MYGKLKTLAISHPNDQHIGYCADFKSEQLRQCGLWFFLDLNYEHIACLGFFKFQNEHLADVTFSTQNKENTTECCYFYMNNGYTADRVSIM